MLKSKKTGEELLHFWIPREIRLKGITFFWGSWRGPGPGRVPRISSDRVDRIVAKIKTQKNPWTKIKPPKNPMPNFRAIKIARRTTWPGYAGTIMNLQIVLKTPKSPYWNQAAQTNTCQTFPTQIIPEIENFKPKKILRSYLSLEIRSSPPWGRGQSS